MQGRIHQARTTNTVPGCVRVFTREVSIAGCEWCDDVVVIIVVVWMGRVYAEDRPVVHVENQTLSLDEFNFANSLQGPDQLKNDLDTSG